MKNTLSTLVAIACLSTLTGCGGGDDGSSSSAARPSTATELEGTWVAATDGRTTGGACGLNSSGSRGERTTIAFNMNRFTYKEEDCIIIGGGNTGSYFETSSASGTFTIGDIVRTSSDPGSQLRALDLITSPTVYTSYNLTAGKLTVAIPFQTYDGTTRDKRAFQTGTYYDTVSRTLISAPVFTKF
jgi:hypothetical protein